ncbi:MAG: SDR family oxidoreductase [Phycisphaerae bacterium]|nr:SDR family oxidoreductase [Phycisphaerae bacterium]
MNVLVTGGAGYIGCRLIPALLTDGHNVRVVDKLIFGDGGLAPVRDRIELIPGDILALPPSALKDMDAVVHLAGLSNDPTAEFNPAANKAMNTDATIRIGEMAKKAGVKRFVFASSCSIYYTMNPDNEMRSEEFPVDPQAPYSWSKRQAEIGLLNLTDSNFCPVMLRKGTVYGQSPRMRYDLVINTFTRDAYSKRRLTLHAGGRMWRPMLHIDDAVDAYRIALSAPEAKVKGQIFNALSDNYPVIKLAHEVRRTLEGHKGIRLDLDLQPVGISRSYRVDGDRFRNALGFNPQHEMGRSVDEMWDELEGGIDIDNPIYYNIRWLELLCDMETRLKAMGGSVFLPGEAPRER